ncbi:pilus assembly PilX family protein [Variovorax paradoxus]|uniref:pilus assembly PilX family protein n=1 Tax=Variovorax paradoxus TaxID=34073 RepID=UPI00278603F7|nr:PilX N-terminal domain-containing pilus assembly protein [Variovorax paradoxus]MDP9932506.1 Tfp pilus assembly protein PilX [Variovorax paradoxus]
MKMPSVRRAHRAQSGAVLMIGMVMLLMISLIAISVIRLSTRHTQIVGNEQVRSEAVAAANYALDTVMNQPYTSWDPSYRTATGSTTSVNLGTSKTDDSAAGTAGSMNVAIKNLECKRARVIKSAELVQRNASGTYYVASTDASCFGGGGSPGLTIVDTSASGSPNDNSLCATVLYDMQAQANDPKLLSAAPLVQQGVEVRTDITALTDSCS